MIQHLAIYLGSSNIYWCAVLSFELQLSVKEFCCVASAIC